MRERRIWSGSAGTATVEFVGMIPALLLATLIAAQFLAAGFSLWSASVGARAGARAAHIGDDPAPAVRRALPGLLSDQARVRRTTAGAVIAQVEVPRLIPFLPVFRLEAQSSLGAR